MKNLILIAAMTLFTAIAVAASYKDMSSLQAKTLLDKGGVFLLDVRTPEEFRQARLKDGVLIPVDQIERRLGEIPRNRPIIVYCAVGSRSAGAASFLAEKGFRDVSNMKDGIVGWYRNGLPILR